MFGNEMQDWLEERKKYDFITGSPPNENGGFNGFGARRRDN